MFGKQQRWDNLHTFVFFSSDSDLGDLNGQSVRVQCHQALKNKLLLLGLEEASNVESTAMFFRDPQPDLPTDPSCDER